MPQGKYYKNYNGFILFVDDYKENDKFQFRLDTPLPFINPNLDFNSPEEAFVYAEVQMIENFARIVEDLIGKHQ